MNGDSDAGYLPLIDTMERKMKPNLRGLESPCRTRLQAFAEICPEVRRTLEEIVDMIDECRDAPRNPGSLPQAIKAHARSLLSRMEPAPAIAEEK